MRAQWVPIIALVAIVADDSAGAGWRCRMLRGDRSGQCDVSTGVSAPPPAWAVTLPSTECDGSLPTVTSGGQPFAFSRGSSAYCTKADGSMVLLSSNQPRVSSASGEQALLMENARTNSWLHSQDVSNAAWVALNGGGASLPTKDGTNTTTAPDGTLTADTVTFQAVTSTQRSGFYQVASFTGQGSLSIYVKGVSSGGTLDVCGTLAGPQGTSVAYNTTTWTRICDPDKAAISAGSTPFIGHNGQCNGGVARAANQVYIWQGQFEQGSDCTSAITTAGVAATRAVEDAFIDGTGLPSTLNGTQGCLSARVKSIVPSPSSVNATLGCGAFGTNASVARMPYFAGSVIAYDGTNSSTGGAAAYSDFANFVRVGALWSAAGLNSYNSVSGYGTINATYSSAWWAGNLFIGHAGVGCGSPHNIWLNDIKGDTTTTRCAQ